MSHNFRNGRANLDPETPMTVPAVAAVDTTTPPVAKRKAAKRKRTVKP
jgi:hypothetical protein